MGRPRIGEVRLVTELLMKEADTAEKKAIEIIEAMDEARLERAKKERRLGLLTRTGEGLPLLVVGPFSTPKGLERWAKQNRINPTETTTVVVRRPEEV